MTCCSDIRHYNSSPPASLLLCLPAVASIDWDTWLHAPGMPPVSNSYDTSMASAAYDLAVRWHTADVMGIGADAPAGVGPDDIQGWSSAQVGLAGGILFQSCLCTSGKPHNKWLDAASAPAAAAVHFSAEMHTSADGEVPPDSLAELGVLCAVHTRVHVKY
jgi:hypothetical protein